MLEPVLSEPWPSLTDLALGLVAVWLARRAAGTGISKQWRTMLWWAAIAALAGAVHHAFVTWSDRWTGPSWAVISAMVVLTISYALAATVRDVLGPGRRRVFWVLRMGSLLAYGVLALLGHYGVATIVACEGVTMACVLGLWTLALVRGYPGAPAMMVALAANVLAGITRALPSGVTELIGLDPVSVYHLAQIPPMVMLYVALVERARLVAAAPAVEATADGSTSVAGRGLEQRDE
jgi:hypothetical protein